MRTKACVAILSACATSAVTADSVIAQNIFEPKPDQPQHPPVFHDQNIYEPKPDQPTHPEQSSFRTEGIYFPKPDQPIPPEEPSSYGMFSGYLESAKNFASVVADKVAKQDYVPLPGPPRHPPLSISEAMKETQALVANFISKQDYTPLPRPEHPPSKLKSKFAKPSYGSSARNLMAHHDEHNDHHEHDDHHSGPGGPGGPAGPSHPGPEHGDHHSGGEPKPKPKPKPGPADPVAGTPVTLPSDNTVYVYPGNPYVAGDYETLRAEVELLSTRHSEDYMQAMYIALSTVKGECYVDYSSFCAPSDPIVSDPALIDVVPSFNPFGITQFISSFLPSQLMAAFDVTTQDYPAASSTGSIDSESSVDTAADSVESISSDGVVVAYPVYEETLIQRMDRESSSSSSSSSGEVQYMAPLGFGEDGDICIYSNYNALSYGCQQSISDVYFLHDQFEQEEEDEHHPPMFLLFLVSLLFLSFSIRCCSRLCGPAAKKRAAVHSILESIRNDPELKARVEAISGHAIPEKCNGGKNRCSFAFVFRLLSAFLIVFVATIITCNLVSSLVTTDENGEQHGPGVVVVFLLMLSIIVLIISFVRMCQFAYLKFVAPQGGNPPDLYSSTRRGAHNAYLWGRNLFRSNNQPTGYASLGTPEPMDDGGAEMAFVSSHPSGRIVVQPICCTGVPVSAPPSMAQPVSARPYSSVTML